MSFTTRVRLRKRNPFSWFSESTFPLRLLDPRLDNEAIPAYVGQYGDLSLNFPPKRKNRPEDRSAEIFENGGR